MLKDILISEVRVKILALLLVESPTQSLHVRDIVRKVGTEINAVRRELERLSKVGFVKRRPRGNKVFYDVNREFIYYPELVNLVAKEFGLGSELIKNTKNLGNITFAAMSRALIGGRIAGQNDVDLLIVGSIDANFLKEIIKKYEELYKHEINYTVMGDDEFVFRKKRREPFIMQLLCQTRVMLIGNEEEFCSLL
ncbi:MAG: winged helix-turn-helix domain-containing protein [Patescibacteria group bacterium]